MNTKTEENLDEFEKQLASLPILEPSENYGKISAIITEHKTKPWLPQWKLVTAGTLTCLVAAFVIVNLITSFSSRSSTAGSEEIQPANPSRGVAEVANAPNLDVQPTAPYVLGTHYMQLSTPVPAENPDIVEVVAFFWYPCNPCYQFDGLLANWETENLATVELTQIPAIWSGRMRFHARAYYTAETLGILNRAHDRFYQAMQEQGQTLEDELSLIRFFSELGISASEFLAAFNSDVTLDKLQLAEQANQDYQIQATPTLYVAGRFGITATTAGGFQEMLKVADYLIDTP